MRGVQVEDLAPALRSTFAGTPQEMQYSSEQVVRHLCNWSV